MYYFTHRTAQGLYFILCTVFLVIFGYGLLAPVDDILTLHPTVTIAESAPIVEFIPESTEISTVLLPIPEEVIAIVAAPKQIQIYEPAPTTPSEPTVPSEPITPSKPPTSPTHARLYIPRINVDARIRSMGMTPEGAMAIPDSTIDVGWFSLGTQPGEAGSAVIGGHNFWHDTTGVFYRLEELRVGDSISVIDVHGVSTSFVVREMRSYNPDDDATEIFSSSGGTHLNLITCSGVWDPSTNSYTKRFVVFADLQSATLARAQ